MATVTMGARLSQTGSDSHIAMSVPLTMKRPNGRKEIIVPGGISPECVLPANDQEALVISIARAHRWKRLLDEGKFKSITDIAEAVGMDVSFAARLMRLTLLAPDIIEGVLAGEEPADRMTVLSLPIVLAQPPPLGSRITLLLMTSSADCVSS